MDGILTYLAGDVTAYDIVALILGWLLFNAGFVAGAAWKGLHRKPEPSARPGYIDLGSDNYHAVRCRLRSPEGA